MAANHRCRGVAGLVALTRPSLGRASTAATGWGGWVAGIAPRMMGVPRGDALFVFALA